MINKTRLTEQEIKEQQKLLDEMNRSGKFSFNQTVDEYGIIQVDCDPETVIQEMGLITIEESNKRINQIIDANSHEHSTYQ